MKKILLGIVSTLLMTLPTHAQLFDWKTNDSIQAYDSIGGAYMSLYMENNTEDSLLLDWHFVENTFPAEWEWTLCDYTTCYLVIPDTGSMTTLIDTAEGLLSLSINTNKHPGVGIMRFYVYNELKPVDGDTGTFILNSTYTGINEIYKHISNLEIFPNPTSESFSFLGLQSSPREWWILDLSGKTLLHEFVRDMDESYDVSNLPNGLYLLRMRDSKNGIYSSRLIKQ